MYRTGCTWKSEDCWLSLANEEIKWDLTGVVILKKGTSCPNSRIWFHVPLLCQNAVPRGVSGWVALCFRDLGRHGQQRIKQSYEDLRTNRGATGRGRQMFMLHKTRNLICFSAAHTPLGHFRKASIGIPGLDGCWVSWIDKWIAEPFFTWHSIAVHKFERTLCWLNRYNCMALHMGPRGASNSSQLVDISQCSQQSFRGITANFFGQLASLQHKHLPIYCS